MFTTLEGAIALLMVIVLATTRPVLAHDQATSVEPPSSHAHHQHAEAPVHRLELLLSSSRPAAPSALILSGPDGLRREIPLVREGDRLIADLEWKVPGAMRLTLAGVPGNHASWSTMWQP